MPVVLVWRLWLHLFKPSSRSEIYPQASLLTRQPGTHHPLDSFTWLTSGKVETRATDHLCEGRALIAEWCCWIFKTVISLHATCPSRAHMTFRVQPSPPARASIGCNRAALLAGLALIEGYMIPVRGTKSVWWNSLQMTSGAFDILTNPHSA